MHGEEGFHNSGMEYGSRVSHALETGEEDEDPMINMLMDLIPRYSVMEHEIKVPFKTPKGEVILLGKLDTFEPVTCAFREYKTGRTKWTQRMAEQHKQIDHYSALVYLENGKLPPRTDLDWAETDIYNDAVVLTGKIQSFKVTKTMREVLQYLALVSKVAVEIDARYREELKKLT